MRLDRPTHVIATNRSPGWMSEFPEEVPAQISAIINRLGDRRYTHLSIYPLPADTAYDETIHPTVWMQATGVAPDRLTVEIKQADAEGVHRLYTIGRPDGTGEAAETAPIQNGDNTYLVRPSEVLTATDAIALFQHYYDTHTVLACWSLREQPEFSDTAVAEALAEEALRPPECAARSKDDVRFSDVFVSREDRYSIGTELDSGRWYVSIPVSNGMVGYEEYYAISPGQSDLFLTDRTAAIEFVEACRRRLHDDLLIQKPGVDRGTAL